MSARDLKRLQKSMDEQHRIIMDLDGLRLIIKRSSLGPRLKLRCLSHVDDYEQAIPVALEQVIRLQQVCNLVDDKPRWTSLEMIRMKM